MVMASRFFSVFAIAAAAGPGCDADATCILPRAALGASQLQVKSSASGSRGLVSEAEASASSLAQTANAYLMQGQRLHSAAASVQQAVARMNASYSPSVDQLSNLINGFNNHVSSSYDGCSTQLYELRQQLSLIHQQVYSLTVEVNSTEYGIYSYEQACREKTSQISVIEQTRRTRHTKCVTEQNSARKTLSLLKIDLVQMRQLATTRIRVGSVGGAGSFGNSGYGTGYGTGGVYGTFSGSAGHGIAGGDGTFAGSAMHGIGGGAGYISSSWGSGVGQGYAGPSTHTVIHSTSTSSMSGSTPGGSGVSVGYGTGGGYGTGTGFSTGVGYSSGGTGSSTSTGMHSTGTYGYSAGGITGYGLLETEASVHEPSQSEQGAELHHVEAPRSDASAVSPPQQSQPEASVQTREERTSAVQSLVKQAQDLSQRANDCMSSGKQPQQAEVFLEIGQENNESAQGKAAPYGPGPTSPGYGAGPTFTSPSLECREIILQLEHTFTSAYVSLTRLIEEYSVVVSSTVCVDTVEEEYQQQVTVVQTAANQVCHRVQVFIQHLEQFKIQLTEAITAQHQLEHSLLMLTQQCGSLTQTSNYLYTVSSTLIALGNCPGLNGTSFSLPTWAGAWVYISQELYKTDAEIDASMLDACKAAYPNYGYTVRPAEVAEIDQTAISGMPTTNTARSPLLGSCPMCEGDEIGDAHGRICWDTGAALNEGTKRTDCRMGERAVLCVYEPSSTAAY